jgi:hypothetical protein
VRREREGRQQAAMQRELDLKVEQAIKRERQRAELEAEHVCDICEDAAKTIVFTCGTV